MSKESKIEKQKYKPVFIEYVIVILLCFIALYLFFRYTHIVSLCFKCWDVKFLPPAGHQCYYCEKHKRYHTSFDGRVGGIWCRGCCQWVAADIAVDGVSYPHKCSVTTEKK